MRVSLLICVLGALVAAFPASASAAHRADVSCADFANQREAQNHIATHPGDRERLGADMNGRPCESLPCPCGATVGAPGAVTPPLPAPLPAATVRPLDGDGSTRGRVVRVIGGNALRIRLTTGEVSTVRLIGVDSPTIRSRRRVECGARQAAARLRSLAFRNGRGRTVSLRTDPRQDGSDRSGRMLAYVSSSGVDFGRSMILSGWARASRSSYQRAARYRSAQSSARAAGRGAWRQCGGNFHRVR